MSEKKKNRKFGIESTIYDKLPAYVRIKLHLQNLIKDGTYAPHSRLPSEDELCAQFQVARGTVRQALSELSSEGLIYRVHGKGTFVRSLKYEHEVTTACFKSFWDELTEKGVDFETQILSVERCRPDKQMSSHLRIHSNSEQIFSIRRLRKIEGKTAMYSINRIPCSICPEIGDGKVPLLSIYDTLHDSYGIEIDMGQRLFSSIGASKELSEMFEVPEGYPIIFVEQIVYDEKGRCIDYAHLWLRSEFFHFSATMKRRTHQETV
jgi:GntR family transcriptional regulator